MQHSAHGYKLEPRKAKQGLWVGTLCKHSGMTGLGLLPKHSFRTMPLHLFLPRALLCRKSRGSKRLGEKVTHR